MNIARCRMRTLSQRNGFTLVELLAALGISLLLIAAVSTSLETYVRLTTTSETAIERQQVTRSLLQQMTRDISSIVFTVPEEESEDELLAEVDSLEETEPEPVEIADAADSISTSSVGLIGDSQSLVLNVSRPARNLGYAAPLMAVSLDERTSDLLSVSYFLAAPGGGGLAGAVSENALYSLTSTGSSDGTGFSRLEGDRMAIDHADLQMDTQLLAGAADLIAPEIVYVQFRYFDGTIWLDMWDSTAYGALPQAIEVTFGFRGPPEQDSTLVGNSTWTVEEYVRHVIHVPISEPYSASATY